MKLDGSLCNDLGNENKDTSLFLRFGTMIKFGLMINVVEESYRYSVDIVAIQGRWKGKDIINQNNYTVYFSGNEEKQADCGVKFIIDKRIWKSVLRFIQHLYAAGYVP